jgi:deoxycytidine triphosphate deaminase
MEGGSEMAGSAEKNLGTLLSGEELLDILREDGESHIFLKGTWRESQIKGAGYDLRMAGNLLVYPKSPGSSEVAIVKADAEPRSRITLDPGDTALVSTMERFCMDFDVSAQLGPKFKWAAQGLLILHGMVAHPGYGRELINDMWIPKKDERLYFIVANVGPDEIVIKQGEAILCAQFFRVQRARSPRPIENFGFDYLTERLFGSRGDSGGLAYFRDVRDLRAEVGELRGEVSDLDKTIERVRSVTDNVVVFGVFLVSTTILGVVLVTLINLIESAPGRISDLRATLISALAGLYAVAAVAGVLLVGMGTVRSMRERARRKTSTDGSA